MDKEPVLPGKNLPECLVVDGYNMIYGWESLKHIAASDMNAAREELISMLVNYQGYKGISLIIVFDGWRKNTHQDTSAKRGSATIVYTHGHESADAWIEKKVHDLKG